MGKFYAIKEGFDFVNNKKVTNIILTEWNDCKKYVTGVKSARYKSFLSKAEADSYLEAGSKTSKEGDVTFASDILHAYTDGSYNNKTGKAAYGVVYVRDNIVEGLDYGAIAQTEGLNQVIGELKAALKAAHYAYANKKDIVIHYDYEGVASHALGMYKANGDVASAYNSKMQAIMKSGINIHFVKVDAHTGTLYNELADELCKNEIGISSNNAVNKILGESNSKINVCNNSVSTILTSIGVYSTNIDITGITTKNQINIQSKEPIIDIQSNAKQEKESTYTMDRLSIVEQILVKIPKASTEVLQAINQLLIQ